jgi:GntR family transcriptional regulator/MocR family aminotransferase
VFYLGTFTNTMFPGLRLAYLVAPAAFVEPLVEARATHDGGQPTLPQAVLYDFIDQGHFAAHVMRMARLYRARRNALEREVAARLGGRLTLRPADTGVHVLGEFDAPMDDRAFATRATSLGLDLTPVAHSYVQQPPPRPGLVLGYASLTPQQIRDGVAAIASLLAMEDAGRSA